MRGSRARLQASRCGELLQSAAQIVAVGEGNAEIQMRPRRVRLQLNNFLEHRNGFFALPELCLHHPQSGVSTGIVRGNCERILELLLGLGKLSLAGEHESELHKRLRVWRAVGGSL